MYKGHVLAASLQYSELPGADESDNKDIGNPFTSNSGTQSWKSSNLKESERDSLIIWEMFMGMYCLPYSYLNLFLLYDRTGVGSYTDMKAV